MRPDLRHYWNYTIWVQIDWQTMLERAAKRDVAWGGPAEIAVNRYHTFWIPTHELYEAEANPTCLANIIVDNQYPETPDLLKVDAFEANHDTALQLNPRMQSSRFSVIVCSVP